MIKFSDLTPEQIREICGKMRDLEKINDAGYCPNYPNCKNAMHRIIEGMDGKEMIDYIRALKNNSIGICLPNIIRMTCEQQFVAAAMALGLIKEGEK
jgi:hypothetical protein